MGNLSSGTFGVSTASPGLPASDPTMGIWGLAAPLAQDYSRLGFFVLKLFAELATIFSALVCLSLFCSHTPSPSQVTGMMVPAFSVLSFLYLFFPQ